MIRSMLGVLGGVIAAVVVVAVLEAVGHVIYPPPPGIDLSNHQQIREIIDRIPLGAKIVVLVAWCAGALVGGFVAAAIARQAHAVHALIVGVVQFALGVVTMLMIPHPLWFMIASVIVLPSSWLGGQMAKWLAPSVTTSGPRPYDMRQKNMAC